MTTSTYAVTGMTCEHCVRAVTEEVRRIEGVADVTVDLPTGALTISSSEPIEHAAVAEAVAEAGYQLAAR
jgi:copper ion binding protein